MYIHFEKAGAGTGFYKELRHYRFQETEPAGIFKHFYP
jgi:hypothetical protein